MMYYVVAHDFVAPLRVKKIGDGVKSNRNMLWGDAIQSMIDAFDYQITDMIMVIQSLSFPDIQRMGHAL